MAFPEKDEEIKIQRVGEFPLLAETEKRKSLGGLNSGHSSWWSKVKIPSPDLFSERYKMGYKCTSVTTGVFGLFFFLSQFMPLIVAALKSCPDESRKECINRWNPVTPVDVVRGDINPDHHLIIFYVLINVCWLCCCLTACAMGYGARKASKGYTNLDEELRTTGSQDQENQDENSKLLPKAQTPLFQEVPKIYTPKSTHYGLYKDVVEEGQEKSFDEALQDLEDTNKFDNVSGEENIKQIISNELGGEFSFAKISSLKLEQ